MVSKSKLCLILASFVATVSLSCASNIINNVIPTSNGYHETGITFDEFKKRERNELLNKIKNKTDKNYQIENLIINTGMLNASGKVFKLQSENVRNKKFSLDLHQTNQAHNNKEEQIIFDPKIANSLNYLQVYEGNSVDQNGNPVSSMKINDDKTYNFEPDVAIVHFKSNNGLNLFKNLYNAEIQDELDGYYKLKVDINKSPIEKTEELLERLNTKLPENIKNIEFSSLSSMKLFLIMCDFVLNHLSELESIEYNLISENQIPIIDVNDWEHPITPSNNPTNIKSWWLTQTNVISPFINSGNTYKIDIGASAWEYSIGTGAKIAVIDLGFNLSHPEFQRRLITNEQNNDLSHNVLDNLHNHGSLMSMVMGGEKNNNTGSVGIAPNVKIAPYFGNTSWNYADRTESAVANGAKIINMSFVVPNDFWFNVAELPGLFNFERQIINAVGNNVTIIAAAGNNAKPIKDNFPAKFSDVNGFIVVGGVDIIPYDLNPGTNFGKPVFTASFTPMLDSDPKKSYCKTGHNGFDPNDSCNDYNGKGSGWGTYQIWAPWQDYAWASPVFDIRTNSFPIKNNQVGGTSAATAFTSGVVALMLSRNPDLTPQDIEKILHDTANKNNKISNHKFMNDANFSDPDNLRLIDAREAVIQAIKENKPGTGRSNNPDAFKVKDFGGGEFSLDSGALSNSSSNNQQIGTFTFKDKTTKRLLRTVNDDEFSTSDGKSAILKGWEINSGEIEVLSLEVIPTPKIDNNNNGVIFKDINGLNNSEIKDKGYIIINGENLFSTITTELVFKDISTNIEYIFPIDRNLPNNNLGADGKFILVTFEASKAVSNVLKSTGGFVSMYDIFKANSNAEFKISYQIVKERSNEYFYVDSTTNTPITAFKVSSTFLPPTVTYNNETVQVVTEGSKIKVKTGQTIALPIPTQLNSQNLNDFILNIGGQSASVKELLDWYLIANVPPGISRDAQKIIIGFAGGGNITYEEAIEIIAISVGLKPSNSISFPNGTTLSSDQFIASGQTEPVKVVKGGLYGLAVNGDVNLNDISVFADGHRCTLLDVVQNYALYKIPPQVDTGIKNVIIEHAGGGSLTLEQALEVLVVSAGIIPNQSVTFPNGDSISPDKFVGNNFNTKLYPGDTVGFAFNTKVDINNISIMANGERCTLRSVVDNYVSFNISPNIDPGVVDLIIEYAGGGPITLEQALEILANGGPINPDAINKVIMRGFSFPTDLLDIFDSETEQFGTLIQGSNSLSSLGWSPDKYKIVYALAGLGIYTMNPDGSENNLIFGTSYNVQDLKWSTNGQKIAGIIYIAGNRKLFTMNPDGSNYKEFTEEQNGIYYNWARNSSKILFSTDRQQVSGLYMANPDGTNETKIIEDSNQTGISYPDILGNKIIYLLGNDIWSVDLDGSNPIKLTDYENTGILAIEPKISPDGKKIAFKTPFHKIYTMNSNGTSLQDATENQFYYYSINFSWSPDSKRIVYSTDSNASSIYIVDADGTNRRQISLGFNNYTPKWSTKNLKSPNIPLIQW